MCCYGWGGVRRSIVAALVTQVLPDHEFLWASVILLGCVAKEVSTKQLVSLTISLNIMLNFTLNKCYLLCSARALLVYLCLNYLFNLSLVYHAIYISVWCFIFDKMVASKCFLWSSTFTWSNSVRIDIRWDEGWRDEMTTTYTYKLTSIEICIYFDIDLLTCFMQFMAALRGLHSPMLGAVESEVRNWITRSNHSLFAI